jgi:hypothetical protein
MFTPPTRSSDSNHTLALVRFSAGRMESADKLQVVRTEQIICTLKVR